MKKEMPRFRTLEKSPAEGHEQGVTDEASPDRRSPPPALPSKVRPATARCASAKRVRRARCLRWTNGYPTRLAISSSTLYRPDVVVGTVDVVDGQQCRVHRVVLIVVLVHAIATDEMNIGTRRSEVGQRRRPRSGGRSSRSTVGLGHPGTRNPARCPSGSRSDPK
jgi:hypothetical protein